MKKFKLVKEKWYFQSLRDTKSVQALEDWAVEISWYASTKDKDRWWDVVEPKAFASALERYMTNPIVLLQHKTDKPIWIVEEADIDENWLYIKAKISQNTDWVIDLIKNWVLRAFSIWYSVKDYDTDVRELADWSYDMTNIIKDLELYEISVVSVPMNPYALSKSVEDLLEVEEHEEAEDNQETEENVEESETEEVVEEKVEENEEEKAIEDWSEIDQNVEEESEWTNVQSEEEIVENESEATEQIEESPNEEVETKEMNEEENEKVDSEEKIEWTYVDPEYVDEESTSNEADEQSEIDEESVEEDSENAVETPANEDEVVETHNDEIVETKSIETESQKQFDFESKIAQLEKSFDEKIAIKEEKIKELESKVEKMTQLFADSISAVDRMATNVKNTPVASGLQYKRPLKKWWYYDVASIIKNL